jgi:hypothetical protein
MKVSIVMQSYLGEYPGSRSDSDVKFIRAVNSFINQDDKDSELIIVSDGCMITHNLYYEHFKTNDRIKYVYIDKDTLNMYEVTDKKFYRGFPREVGRTLVTGEITTYMDSDDFILPNHISEIKSNWSKFSNISWLINLSWYENIHRFYNPILEYNDTIQPVNENEITTIFNLPSEWIPYRNKINDKTVCIPMQTSVLNHLSNLDVKWVDTFGINEDMTFNKKIRIKYKGDNFYTSPTYVRCHYSNRWDF